MDKFAADQRATAAAGPLSRIGALVRASQWWEFKLLPTLAVLYASALVAGVPLIEHWRSPLMLLALLVPGAAFVSLTNDWFDRASDAAAGKPNRLAAMRAPVFAVLAAACVALGVGAAVLARLGPVAIAVYAAAWIAFTLYSAPPLRLKARGAAGLLADATGAHLVPAMLAILVLQDEAGVALPVLWFGAVGLWSLAYGLRGILNHQLIDQQHDRKAGLGTFVARHGKRAALRMARRALFPLESLGLIAMMTGVASPFPVVALLLYGAYARMKLRQFEMPIVIVDPRPRYLLILHEFYDVFWPIALLIALAAHDMRDSSILAAHLLLFPGRWTAALRDAFRLRADAFAAGD